MTNVFYENGLSKERGIIYEKKEFSLILALMVCVSMAFSTSNPVKAEPAHVESAHADCTHDMPPKVETEDLGYNINSTHHWKVYRHTVRCSRCNNVMQVTSTSGAKELHVRYGDSKKCAICNHSL